MTKLVEYQFTDYCLLDLDTKRSIRNFFDNLLNDGEVLYFIGEGKLNPDEDIINTLDLDAIVNELITKIIFKDRYFLMGAFEYNYLDFHKIINLMSSYSLSMIIVLEKNYSQEDFILAYKKKKFFCSKFNFSRYKKILHKAIFAANSTCSLGICFDLNKSKMADYFDYQLLVFNKNNKLGFNGKKQIIR